MKHKKVCRFCRKWFLPDGRNKSQRVCPRKRCRKERERREWRRWAAKNKEVKKVKLRVWAKAYPNYWRHYRGTRDEYRRKDSRRRCKAMRRDRLFRKAKAETSS